MTRTEESNNTDKQPRFDYPARPFHFTGSSVLTNSSLLSEACLFAEYPQITFSAFSKATFRDNNFKFSFERFLREGDIYNFNMVNSLSFFQLLEAVALYDNIIVLGGADSYDILSHNFLYNRCYSLSQFLIDEGIVHLVGDYNWRQLEESNIPRQNDHDTFKKLGRKFDNVSRSQQWTLISNRESRPTSDFPKLTNLDFEWSMHGVYMFHVNASLYAIPNVLNPRWMREANYFASSLNSIPDHLKVTITRQINQAIEGRIRKVNQFAAQFGGTQFFTIPPVAGYILGLVSQGATLSDGIMTARNKLKRFRRHYQMRLDAVRHEDASICDVERLAAECKADIDYVSQEISGFQGESWLLREYRTLPQAIEDIGSVAESVNDPTSLIKLLAIKLKENLDSIATWYRHYHLRQYIAVTKHFLKSEGTRKGIESLTGVKLDDVMVRDFNRAINILIDQRFCNKGVFLQFIGPRRCEPMFALNRQMTGDDTKWLEVLKNSGWIDV